MNSIRLTPLFALPVAVSLILGAIARDAQAGICKKRNLPRGCVNSGDVENQSLGTKFLKDEAGLNFDVNPGSTVVLTLSNRVVASRSLSAPKKGWVIATASTTIIGVSGSSKGVARCEITAGVIGAPAAFGLKPILGSVNTEKGAHMANMAATLGFEVPKGQLKFKVFLQCRLLSGGPLQINESSLVIQYHPTRYKAP